MSWGGEGVSGKKPNQASRRIVVRTTATFLFYKEVAGVGKNKSQPVEQFMGRLPFCLLGPTRALIMRLISRLINRCHIPYYLARKYGTG